MVASFRLFRRSPIAIAALGLAGGPLAASAASCQLPIPFQYEFSNQVTSSLSPDSAGVCSLAVATASTARTTTAGILHYRRATPLTSVRYAFRVDTSALAVGTTTQAVQFFSAVAPVVVTTPSAQSNPLSIYYTVGTTPTLRFLAASDGAPVQVTYPLTGTLTTVRVQIDVGSDAAGKVTFWIDHDYTDAPDGVIERSVGTGLNNAAFQGVIGAEIGLSNASTAYLAAHAGEAVVFDQIESSDDVLFYDDFSSGAQ